MNLSGIYLLVVPGQFKSCINKISQLPGVEVHYNLRPVALSLRWMLDLTILSLKVLTISRHSPTLFWPSRLVTDSMKKTMSLGLSITCLYAWKRRL